MSDMLVKENWHRKRWDTDETYRKMARKGAFRQWSGAILKYPDGSRGSWVPRDRYDEPPEYLMPEVFPCADRAGKYEMINFIEAQINAGLIHATGEWPSEIWNVLWDIADRKYFPHHLKRVLDFTSRQTFSYQTELVQTVGIKYENITKQEHFGILIALVARNLENLVGGEL